MDETTVTIATITARQRVEAQRPLHLEIAGVDPGEEIGGDAVAVERHLDEQHDAEDRGDRHADAGDDLRAAVADPAAEEAGDERAQKRQEDGCDRHRLSPSSG